jgi:hypothetical protein
MDGGLAVAKKGNFGSTLTAVGVTSTGGLTVSGGGAAINNTAGITTDQTTFPLVNATVTTLNFASAATTINMGGSTGTLTIGNPTVVGSQTTANLWNTTATTVNLGGAATTLSLGASTGTASINNATVTLGNATTVNFSAATTFNVNGANPTLASSSTGTLTLFNTGLTTVNAFGASTTTTLGATNGTINLRGMTSINQVQETLLTKTGATGTVVHDFSTGAIFYHSSIAANFTANFTNMPTTADKAYAITLILNQGGTGYIPNAVQVNGSAVTLRWANNTTPTAGTSKIDQVMYTLVYTGSTWYCTAQYTSFA